MRVWPVGVSLLKSELYNWLNLTLNEDGSLPNGYCHFPKYDMEFFKQLTAEQLVTRIVKGHPKRNGKKRVIGTRRWLPDICACAAVRGCGTGVTVAGRNCRHR